jgi:hypothetical protein
LNLNHARERAARIRRLLIKTAGSTVFSALLFIPVALQVKKYIYLKSPQIPHGTFEFLFCFKRERDPSLSNVGS